jgi:hypothetical protein
MTGIFRRKRKEEPLDSGPDAFNLLMKDAIVREFLDEDIYVHKRYPALIF